MCMCAAKHDPKQAKGTTKLYNSVVIEARISVETDQTMQSGVTVLLKVQSILA